jgi:cytidylate kinase
MGQINFDKIITFDGTSGSGKGTIATKIADHFAIAYLDTGKLYRALSYLLVRNSITNIDNIIMDDFAKQIDNNLLNNPALYDESVTIFASKIAAKPLVRESLFSFQQEFLLNNEGAVLDGRDTGSVICPQAKFKFYIDADIDIRAKRRYNQNKASYLDQNIDNHQIKISLLARDKSDKERKISPLIIPKNAVVIDNSANNLSATIKKIIDIIDY